MNMNKLLKQAQEMQEKLQRELGDTFVEASVGGGIVSVKMDGHKHLVSIKIDPEAVDADDTGMLEDLIVAAVNEASRKMDETLRHKVGSMASSLPSVF
ncbi:MAG: YbaB/EbfC family nucleoid-associated protein [Thermoanaerobaculia bacterium]|nr:YbaB/EbfC family nucleoid-associated protein [Thermoanaerobaculia bacterium]